MNVLISFCFLVLCLSQVTFGEWQKKCFKLLHPKTAMCCSQKIPAPKNMDKVKDCLGDGEPPNFPRDHPPSGPPPCDRDICVAKKLGYWADDGTVIDDALTKVFEEDLAETPKVLQTVKDNCIGKDKFKIYGPEDMCDFVKIRHCVVYQMLNSCPEWIENDSCSGIKQLIDECKIP